MSPLASNPKQTENARVSVGVSPVARWIGSCYFSRRMRTHNPLLLSALKRIALALERVSVRAALLRMSRGAASVS
jgi:hypothetical protein